MDILNGIYPDEYIERWGERFCREHIRARCGISFARFLQFPEHYVVEARDAVCTLKRRAEALAATVDRAAVEDFRRLLPAQRRIAGALNQAEALSAQLAERSVEALPRRNGSAIEKLKHHRFPDSHSDFSMHRRRGGVS